MYRGIIEKWFSEGFISNDFTNMLKALIIVKFWFLEEYLWEYDTELQTRGVKNIIKLALVFKGKEVLIEQA